MRRLVMAGTALGLTVAPLVPWSTVAAHPLGNFSINHAHALTIHPDRIVDLAVVDIAEIPTAQRAHDVDVDDDGTASPDELARYGQAQCEALRDAVELTVDGVPTPFGIEATAYTQPVGQAGLATGRLECTFVAAITVGDRASIALVDGFEADRVGWHEITAVGVGTTLVDPQVPTTSPTDGLRTYPTDLLESPLDVRSADLVVVPGGSTAPAAAETAGGDGAALLCGGPLADVVDRIGGEFDRLVGSRDLTLGVGLLAVLLAMILGASHALLPGHGKTVMAAYIAGRQGSARDAVLVGATVTGTHTGGVLLLGLALTLSTSLAGESVISWLGLVSGAMIAVLGASLLWSALHHRPVAHGHRHVLGHRHGHDHGHGHGHDHDHGHGHDDGHGHQRTSGVVQAQRRGSTHALADHVRAAASGGSTVVLDAPGSPMGASTTSAFSTTVLAPVPSFVVTDRPTAVVPDQQIEPKHRAVSRRGLVGMGIAGGLVPSPSALVVLLSAIALGRTAFGVLLVIGYGLGMAATLTAAGLLLVRVRDRVQRRQRQGVMSRAAARWMRFAPFATATLVVVVGLGIAVRSATSI